MWNKLLILVFSLFATPLWGAMQFDGSDDVVTLTDKLDNVNTFTYCAWVFPETRGENIDGRIIHKGTVTVRKQLQSSGNVVNSFSLFVDRATLDAVVISTINSMDLLTWQHICGTYSEGTGPRLYKNGVEMVYSSSTLGIGTTADDSVDELFIGNRGDGLRTWDGLLDDIRIYDRILSLSEIENLAKSRSRLVMTDGLLAWWSLDQGFENAGSTGTVVLDISGQGNHATPTKGPTWKGSTWINYP